MTDPTSERRKRGSMARVGLLVGASFVALTAPIPLLLTAPSSEFEQRIVDYLLLYCIAVPSFVAFFGLYRIRLDIRDAIAGGFVVAFFCILFLSVNLNIGNTLAGSGSIRQLALSNFMTLVGTIVVFYFGSEAAIRIGVPYVERRAQRFDERTSNAAGRSSESRVTENTDTGY